MKTQFKSNQKKVTAEILSSFYGGNIKNVKTFILESIDIYHDEIEPTLIEAVYYVNGKDCSVSIKSKNIFFVRRWEILMKGNFNPLQGFEQEEMFVKEMLRIVKLDDETLNFIKL